MLANESPKSHFIRGLLHALIGPDGNAVVVDPLRSRLRGLARKTRDPERVAVDLVDVLERLTLKCAVLRHPVDVARVVTGVDAVSPVPLRDGERKGAAAEGHLAVVGRSRPPKEAVTLNPLPRPLDLI